MLTPVSRYQISSRSRRAFDNMERTSTGIMGLDEQLDGGFPKNSTTTVIGAYGTGKSTFGMQFLYEGLRNEEPCIFISLDDGEESLTGAATQFGWDFKQYMDDKLLLLIKLSATNIKTSILRLRSELPHLFKSFGAKRFVFDSITLFEMLFKSDSERRLLVYELTNSIKDSGATALITAEADKNNPYVSRFGLIEYMSDGVIVLDYIRPADRRSVILSLEIVKMRKTKHSRGSLAYEITGSGIGLCHAHGDF